MPVLSLFPSVTLEGTIMHQEVLMNEVFEKGNAMTAQEIATAYVECRRLWEGYKRVLAGQGTMTRKQAESRWAAPFLSYLGYELVACPPTVAKQPQATPTAQPSHEDDVKKVPVHLSMLHSQSGEGALKNGLDDRSQGASPHTVLQQYLNANEATYGLVFNGRDLRLLRDAVRMSRASYVAFDLEVLFEQDLYADFTLLCKLLHQSQMPSAQDQEQVAAIEKYYLLSLESSSKIREKLAVALSNTSKKAPVYGEGAMVSLINGMLAARPAFINTLPSGDTKAANELATKLFEEALVLVYRFLFLSVVEERKLTHAEGQEKERELYMKYYSLQRLRRLVIEGRHVVDLEGTNLWQDMFEYTFGLFSSPGRLDDTKQSQYLGIQALETGIWATDKLELLSHATVPNQDFMAFLEPLSQFKDERGVLVPINYGALDVEELGSIYEGLLDLKAELVEKPLYPGLYEFRFKAGQERANSGSHYTPESLVTPLLVHSLDHLIEEALQQENKVEALLRLRIIDPACGSGHILLSAARRLATAVAKVQHKVEQPDEKLLRPALRQVISRCIYGVDINPMALELCKMAFWLEAHEPGKPLSFLDHHLQHGDALVGLLHATELTQPIAQEAYTAFKDDDKVLVKQLAKENKTYSQVTLFTESERTKITELADSLTQFNKELEQTVADVNKRAAAYRAMRNDKGYAALELHAHALLAPFFIKKNKENAAGNYTTKHIQQGLTEQQKGMALGAAAERKFMHWFLAFPDVMQAGGFDLVVGNPPFLGGQRLSGTYSDNYLKYLTSTYDKTGAIDLVAYFFRRAYVAIKEQRFLSFISTNTIAQGSTREGGLDVLAARGGAINHAVRSMRWPGVAAVEVALVTVHKGEWHKPKILNQREVERITPYLDSAKTIGNPLPLKENEGKSFQGSIVLGKGFILEPEEAMDIIKQDAKYARVLKPYLNGEDLNSRPDQSPSRWVINFYDWPLRRYSTEEWQALDTQTQEDITSRLEAGKFVALAPPSYAGDVAADYPICLEIVERLVKPERDKYSGCKNAWDRQVYTQWWQFGSLRPNLYKAISGMERVMVVARVTKYCYFNYLDTHKVFHEKCVVIPLNSTNYYSILNSNIHTEWSRKYCSTMGDSRLNYSPTDAFQTFPFPTQNKHLERIGEAYHTLRKGIMLEYQLGLTALYNLFHDPALLETVVRRFLAAEQKPKRVIDELMKQFRKDAALADYPEVVQQARALAGQVEALRALHVEMDIAVRDAYGWQDLSLGHGFHEVDYLPENDRVRYTISEQARAVVLERLLEENLRRGKK